MNIEKLLKTMLLLSLQRADAHVGYAFMLLVAFNAVGLKPVAIALLPVLIVLIGIAIYKYDIVRVNSDKHNPDTYLNEVFDDGNDGK